MWSLDGTRRLWLIYFPNTVQDIGISAARQTEICKDACDEWARVANIQLRWVNTTNGPLNINIHWSTFEKSARGQAPIIPHGTPMRHRTWVKLNRAVTDWDELRLRKTIVHEVGHALGLPHLWLQYADSVMSPNFNLTVIPDQHDIKQIADKRYGRAVNFKPWRPAAPPTPPPPPTPTPPTPSPVVPQQISASVDIPGLGKYTGTLQKA